MYGDYMIGNTDSFRQANLVGVIEPGGRSRREREVIDGVAVSGAFYRKGKYVSRFSADMIHMLQHLMLR